MIEDEFNKEIFNNLPFVAMLVNEDVKVVDYNEATIDLLGINSKVKESLRGGELINCVNHHKYEDGCGTGEECEQCVLRNAVLAALKGKKSKRLKTVMTLVVGEGKVAQIYAQVSTSLVTISGNKMVLVVVEDANEIAEIGKMISVCSKCRIIRSDDGEWNNFEKYFHDNWHIEFSHGFCPECAKEEIEKIRKLKEERRAQKANLDNS